MTVCEYLDELESIELMPSTLQEELWCKTRQMYRAHVTDAVVKSGSWWWSDVCARECGSKSKCGV